jgi:stage V sporulation protein AD
MSNRLGKQTIELDSKVRLISSGTVVGPKEADGPLGKYFDKIMPDSKWDEKTWEKTESKMQLEAILTAIQKSKVERSTINYIFGGDLLNQCISSSFGLRDLDIPFFGLYGACSTIVEGLSLASMLVDGKYANFALVVTSSHFCAAERQYRTPLEYGGQRTPTSQWTVTGAGAMMLGQGEIGPYITHVTTGKIVDMGVKDQNNMGAAMAPAACDTLTAHFKETKRTPDFYDLIITGDLGRVGSNILRDLASEKGLKLGENYKDAGCMIFDFDKQSDVCSGGSGCGCMATTLCGYLNAKLKAKEYKNILVMATGALMSPTSSLQGESIPSIAHAVAISSEEGPADHNKDNENHDK